MRAVLIFGVARQGNQNAGGPYLDVARQGVTVAAVRQNLFR
jgi:hypothetical protein